MSDIAVAPRLYQWSARCRCRTVAVAGRSAGGPASAIRLPHRIEAELISALGMGTNLDVAAADQSRPSATRAAKLIHPMRSIFIPHLGKMGLAYFSPSECEVAHTSRGINGGHQTPTGPRRPSGGRWRVISAGPCSENRAPWALAED